MRQVKSLTPKTSYCIELAATAAISTWVIVEASSPEEAEYAALAAVKEGDLDWDITCEPNIGDDAVECVGMEVLT